MQNKDLKKAIKLLNNYHCVFVHDDILTIADDDNTSPFAYIISDITHPGFLLLSLSIDYPICENAVTVALLTNTIKSVRIAEPFYISNDGITFWAEEAFEQFELEQTLELDNLEPISKAIN